MTKIKPCPFCGSYDMLLAPMDLGVGTPLYYVRCVDERCEAAGPTRSSKKAAIRIWNEASELCLEDDE